MKFNLKIIAIAAAMASTAGVAQAQIVSSFTNNGTLVLHAFNVQTRAFYYRDLGFTINSFLPTGVLASAGDPSSSTIGAFTPEGGLTLNGLTNANFSDTAGWSTWLASQPVNALTNIRWGVTAVDNIVGSSDGVTRIIASSANLNESARNGEVDNIAGDANAGSAEGFSSFAQNAPNGFSFYNNGAVPADTPLDENFGLGTDGVTSLGQSAGLFYFERSQQFGNQPGVARGGIYKNSTFSAAVSLDNAGNFSYSLLAAPIPLPPALWMMGAGLLAVGGAVRRRKAALKA